MSPHFTSRLNPKQHGFVKMKSTTTHFVTYLGFISPLVSFQRQVDYIYFDFSSAFDFVPHSILLHKLCAYGLSDSYVNWYRNYLTGRSASVRILGGFSSPFAVFSGVPLGSVLGFLLFIIFVNFIYNVIKYSRYLVFSDDIKIFRAVNSASCCTLLQADIEHIQAWCAANCMKLNVSKTRVFYLFLELLYLAYLP